MLIACKRQLAESQQEALKYSKLLQEAIESGNTGNGSGINNNAASAGISKDQLKEMEQQLAMKSNTIRLLEGHIREKETGIYILYRYM